MSRGIKILSKKLVFQAKLFTVRELEYQINEKKFVQNDVVRNPTVMVFPLTENNEIYLISQYRRLLETTSLEAVAGFINDGETPIEAAKRELKEETGITAANWRKLPVLNMAASVTKGKEYLFLATGLKFGNPQPEDDEEIAPVVMHFEKAVEKVLNGEINVATTVAGILLLDKLMQEKKL